MAAQRVTPFRRKARTSGTERMSGALRLRSGTGDLNGAAGVKSAKLCVKQDQIEKRLSAASTSFWVDRKSEPVMVHVDEWLLKLALLLGKNRSAGGTESGL